MKTTLNVANFALILATALFLCNNLLNQTDAVKAVQSATALLCYTIGVFTFTLVREIRRRR